jgi:SAM-dependent methyltransferase
VGGRKEGVMQMQWFRSAMRRSSFLRALALRARFGDLRRVEPLSDWGFERGTPVDRWYIERYLEECASSITGRVLEVQDDVYSSRFGADEVEVVDIDPGNSRADVIGDLCARGTLESGRYDAAVVTQTLQLLSDPAEAVRHLLAALRPGGSLLITAPTVSRLAGDDDRWRWTPPGMRTLLTSVAPTSARVEVVGMGNSLTSRAFLFGMSAQEIRRDVLARSDRRYPSLVGARVRLAL